MARRVRWAEPAALALDEAAAHIASDSRVYAAVLVRDAQQAARSLATLAERGRIVPEIGDPHVRELFVQSYRLIYRVANDVILVEAFVHGARDLSALWSRESHD